MSKGMLGKKLGMTGFFAQDGQRIPVTVIEVGPCVVTQVKTEETDGYNALQLGFGARKAKRTSKALQGHLEKSGVLAKTLCEFSANQVEDYSVGQTITADIFAVGEKIDVVGTTKGRGFAGVIKRHGFRGGPKAHGSRSHRIPGSIGCSAYPGRVIKGKKMPGHYGVDRQTARGLEIVDVRPEDNLILVKGSVPGHRSGVVELHKKNVA